jgi:ATP-dependent Clp protease ATP-binding subunit ClpA
MKGAPTEQGVFMFILEKSIIPLPQKIDNKNGRVAIAEIGNGNFYIENLSSEMLAREGFDDVYGARPLRRAIQRKIEDSLSVELLEEKITAGDKVRATLSDGKIVYNKE